MQGTGLMTQSRYRAVLVDRQLVEGSKRTYDAQ